MEDKYWAMTQLYEKEKEGATYTKAWYRHRWRYNSVEDYSKENEIFIMAPHGGSIETGTTELALATAGFTDDFNDSPATSATYDYFVFNGKNDPNPNRDLHVTARHYDDPVARELVQNSLISLAFHGCKDHQAIHEPGHEVELEEGEEYKACLIGGLDEPFKISLKEKLVEAGFITVITGINDLDGRNPENIINKNKRMAGAQFELTTSFRSSLFGDDSFDGRRQTTNSDFWLFVNTVRECISHYRIKLKKLYTT